jgi:outer membrane immunogenic protein
MKRILIVGALALAAGGQALAADLPQPAPQPPRAPATYVPAQAPYFSWTGIYVGINGGYGFGQSNWTAPVGASTGNFGTSGFLVGGTLGGNYQMGSFVIGLEGDGDWNNANGTTFSSCPAGCTTQSTWLATVRGRAGYAWDRVLLYGTGGAAFGNVQAGAGAFPFASGTQTGWTAGAGVEWAFTPNWTAKVEYLFVNLGNLPCPSTSCGIPFGAPAGTPSTVSFTENIVRAGVNYKFW